MIDQASLKLLLEQDGIKKRLEEFRKNPQKLTDPELLCNILLKEENPDLLIAVHNLIRELTQKDIIEDPLYDQVDPQKAIDRNRFLPTFTRRKNLLEAILIVMNKFSKESPKQATLGKILTYFLNDKAVSQCEDQSIAIIEKSDPAVVIQFLEYCNKLAYSNQLPLRLWQERSDDILLTLMSRKYYKAFLLVIQFLTPSQKIAYRAVLDNDTQILESLQKYIRETANQYLLLHAYAQSTITDKTAAFIIAELGIDINIERPPQGSGETVLYYVIQNLIQENSKKHIQLQKAIFLLEQGAIIPPRQLDKLQATIDQYIKSPQEHDFLPLLALQHLKKLIKEQVVIRNLTHEIDADSFKAETVDSVLSYCAKQTHAMNVLEVMLGANRISKLITMLQKIQNPRYAAPIPALMKCLEESCKYNYSKFASPQAGLNALNVIIGNKLSHGQAVPDWILIDGFELASSIYYKNPSDEHQETMLHYMKLYFGNNCLEGEKKFYASLPTTNNYRGTDERDKPNGHYNACLRLAQLNIAAGSSRVNLERAKQWYKLACILTNQEPGLKSEVSPEELQVCINEALEPFVKTTAEGIKSQTSDSQISNQPRLFKQPPTSRNLGLLPHEQLQQLLVNFVIDPNYRGIPNSCSIPMGKTPIHAIELAARFRKCVFAAGKGSLGIDIKSDDLNDNESCVIFKNLTPTNIALLKLYCASSLAQIVDPRLETTASELADEIDSNSFKIEKLNKFLSYCTKQTHAMNVLNGILGANRISKLITILQKSKNPHHKAHIPALINCLEESCKGNNFKFESPQVGLNALDFIIENKFSHRQAVPDWILIDALKLASLIYYKNPSDEHQEAQETMFHYVRLYFGNNCLKAERQFFASLPTTNDYFGTDERNGHYSACLRLALLNITTGSLERAKQWYQLACILTNQKPGLKSEVSSEELQVCINEALEPFVKTTAEGIKSQTSDLQVSGQPSSGNHNFQSFSSSSPLLFKQSSIILSHNTDLPLHQQLQQLLVNFDIDPNYQNDNSCSIWMGESQIHATQLADSVRNSILAAGKGSFGIDIAVKETGTIETHFNVVFNNLTPTNIAQLQYYCALSLAQIVDPRLATQVSLQ